MKNLTTAIMSKMAGSAFDSAVGSRIFKGRAPQGVQWPYAVFFVVSDVPEDTFKDHIENVLVQFSLFSNDAGSTAEIESIFDNLKSLLDDTVLTITSNTMCLMYRESASLVGEEGDTDSGTGEYWHYIVEYNIVMQKS